MKLKRRFLFLMRESKVTPTWLAKELGLSLIGLARVVNGKDELDEEQSKQLMAMFGAEEMSSVIDWEGMNVRCPI